MNQDLTANMQLSPRSVSFGERLSNGKTGLPCHMHTPLLTSSTENDEKSNQIPLNPQGSIPTAPSLIKLQQHFVTFIGTQSVSLNKTKNK